MQLQISFEINRMSAISFIDDGNSMFFVSLLWSLKTKTGGINYWLFDDFAPLEIQTKLAETEL